MDASLSPLGRLQASFSAKGKQAEDKSMLIRSLSTILHHTSSSTGYARVVRAEEAVDEEDEAMRRFLDGLALIFDSGESGDGAAVAVQVLAQGILLDVVKSSNKHPSVPQHLTLKAIPPESELQAQLEADWPTFFLKWTRFALTPSLHLHVIHSMVTRIHSQSSGRRPTPKQLRTAESLERYTYYFCKEKIRQRLAAVIPTPPKSGYSSPPRLRFRSLFYDDTTLRKSASGEVDFDGRIPDDALSDGLLMFEENNLFREMPPNLRRQDETWLASMIHAVLPEYTITMFNGHLVLDEGIADVVSHFLINSLAELQYHLDELETMLAMDDSSKNLATNRKYMLRCLNELFRPLSILTSMAHESPTCWSIIRCLSLAFEDRIAGAFEPDSESVSSESDSVESLIEESATDFDYGCPGQPIHEKIWKWLESLSEWTHALHQICYPAGIVNSHLRRGFTIRLWIPELSNPIKQASLEDTLSFVNWDPEDERSLEALQNAALAHRQRCISGTAPFSGPRDMYSVSQRILLGMEDRTRWSNAFEGSVHCQGLLACLIKERIIRSRLVATSRPRCSCCSLLFHILEPEVELYAAPSGSRSLPWALPDETDTPKEVKDAVAKALCTRLKQVLWATTTEERRRAVETSSNVVPPTLLTLQRPSNNRKSAE